MALALALSKWKNNLQDFHDEETVERAKLNVKSAANLLQIVQFIVNCNDKEFEAARNNLNEQWLAYQNREKQPGKIPNGKIYCLIVDHGLRSESNDESQLVQEWARKLQLESCILKLDMAKLTLAKGEVMEIARGLRYQEFYDFCANNQIQHLFLGHHAGDQLETFLMRFSRASEIDGLACMQQHQWLILNDKNKNSISILRPFLQVHKSNLRQYCMYHQQQWIEDPSNLQKSYYRVQTRQILQSHSPSIYWPEQIFDSSSQNPFIVLNQEANSNFLNEIQQVQSPTKFGQNISILQDILRIQQTCQQIKNKKDKLCLQLLQMCLLSEVVTKKQKRVFKQQGQLLINIGQLRQMGDVGVDEIEKFVLVVIQGVSDWYQQPRMKGVRQLSDLFKKGSMYVSFTIGGCLIEPVHGTRGAIVKISKYVN